MRKICAEGESLLKIDVVYGNWLKNTTGPSNSLRRFLKNCDKFKEKGIQLTVITLDRYYKGGQEGGLHGWRSVPRGLRKIAYASIKQLALSLYRLFGYSALIAWQVAKKKYVQNPSRLVGEYLREGREVDVIAFHDMFSAYHYLLHAPSSRPKLIFFYHNNGDLLSMLLGYHPSLKGTKYEQILRKKERRILTEVDLVVFVSSLARDHFFSLNPTFPREKTIFFYNGVDDVLRGEPRQRKKQKSSNYRVCCIGTLSHRKGQLTVLQALSLVSKQVRERLEIVFAGGGNILDKLRAQAERLGLKNNVVFLGPVEDVETVLKTSDIMVLPSMDEGLPLSIIEAMSAGLPVIASRVGGIPELVKDGWNGILIDPTAESLAVALEKIPFMDLSLMGERSRSLYEENFTIEKMISSYANAAKSLVIE